MKGARALGYLGLFQVTRRQGGTLSGRYRRNGYVFRQILQVAVRPPSLASQLPQESSTTAIQVGCQAAIAGKPAPTGIEYDRNTGWLSDRHRWQASSHRNRVRPQYRLVVRPPSPASQLPQESSTSAKLRGAVRSPGSVNVVSALLQILRPLGQASLPILGQALRSRQCE
jgi:hypothetical protein